MRRVAALAFLFALFTLTASAQQAPFIHGGTLGTSQSQVLANDPLRKKIIFFNPNSSGNIAFCPVGPNRDTGDAVTCAVNGAGSITLLPYGSLVIDGANGTGPVLQIPSAWYGVGASSDLAYTIYDFE